MFWNPFFFVLIKKRNKTTHWLLFSLYEARGWEWMCYYHVPEIMWSTIRVKIPDVFGLLPYLNFDHTLWGCEFRGVHISNRSDHRIYMRGSPYSVSVLVRNQYTLAEHMLTGVAQNALMILPSHLSPGQDIRSTEGAISTLLLKLFLCNWCRFIVMIVLSEFFIFIFSLHCW